MTDDVVSDAPQMARLRARNQLTLPEPIAARIGAEPGDRFVVLVDGPDSVRLIRVRDSYAGALKGMWGSTQTEADAWLRAERESWRRRQELYDPEGSVER